MAGVRDRVTGDVLDAVYQDAFCTPDGDILSPVCWGEVLGIERDTVTRWACLHLKGLIEAYERDDETRDMTDGEMVLVSGVDMFVAGLAMGLVTRKGFQAPPEAN